MHEDCAFAAAMERFRLAVLSYCTRMSDGALGGILDEVFRTGEASGHSPVEVRRPLTEVVCSITPDDWDIRAELARHLVRRLYRRPGMTR